MEDFLVIGFTQPFPLESEAKEADIICRYLGSEAVDLFHIRKKNSEEAYTRRLLEAIPANLRNRIVAHGHPELAKVYGLELVHNVTSASLHSISEIESNFQASFRYAFLSPIFDSISKQGYKSNFNNQWDEVMRLNEIYPIVALGGITPSKFQKLYDLKFAGAALLGYLWSPETTIEEKIDSLLKNRTQLKNR